MRTFSFFCCVLVCLGGLLVAQQFQTIPNKTEGNRLKTFKDALSRANATDRKIDKRNMSVRWTGRLHVPVSGNYRFYQVPSEYGNSTMSLWIDGALVLTPSGNDGDNEISDNFVSLLAGKSADFRLEFTHEIHRQFDLPVAALMWKSDVLEKQIVPPAAFVSQKDGAGIKGEYFADAKFSRKAFERTDASIEFIWDQGNVEDNFAMELRKNTRRIIQQVNNDTFLTSLTEDEVTEFSLEIVPSLLACMNLSERLAFLDTLTRQPRILKSLSLDGLLGVLKSIGAFTENRHIETLFVWSLESPLPRIEPGTFVSGTGTFHFQNVLPYRRIAEMLVSSGYVVLENEHTIIASLERPDGKCNLTILYALVAMGKKSQMPSKVRRLIDKKLAQQNLSGDSRATWLFAKAYFQEVGLSEMIRPGRGLSVLNEALETAESSGCRFWAIQETVARMIAVNQIDEVKSLLASVRGQFPEEENQALVDQWLDTAKTQAELCLEAENNFLLGTQKEFAQEMLRRSSHATKLGDIQTAREFKTKSDAAFSDNKTNRPLLP